MPARTCPACEAPMPRRHDETASNYRKRQTCSPDCRVTLDTARKRGISPAAARAHRAATLTCQHCRQVLERPPSVPPSEFSARKFCSLKCSHAAASAPRAVTRRTRPAPNPSPPPAPRDGLTPRETLQAAARAHPLLLEYIASPQRAAHHYEALTHVAFGAPEEAAA
jgi:hypothetical protein